MSRSLKIFQLLADHKWTGPAEAVVTLSRDLIKEGHLVRFFCAAHAGRALAEKAAARAVIPVEDLWLDPGNPFQVPWDIFRLGRRLKLEKPDILHVHRSEDHWIAALARKWAGGGPRLVRTIHHPRSLDPRLFRKPLYRSLTDGFITLRRADADRLVQSYGPEAGRVRVIHGAVDAMRFHPDHDPRPIRAEFGIPPSAPVIGMVSRFQPHRRHDEMISAMVRLKARIPTVRLLLVGKGEHLPEIERRVRELELQHHVIFTGYRDRDLPQVYAAMNVAVALACGSEISCRACLEAMACGIPVVGHPVGALSETIVDGLTGSLVPEGDIDRLVDRLADVLSDRATAAKMSEAARQRVEERFSESGRVRATAVFYEELLS